MKKIPLTNFFKKMSTKKMKMCQSIYRDHEKAITTLPGSLSKHQTWKGGYLSHVEETMNIGVVLYNSLKKYRQLNFNLSDALFVLFLHDFDKIFRYKKSNKYFHSSKKYSQTYITQLKNLLEKKYKYTLTSSEQNALQYVHGEGSDYHSKKRIMLPLTAFIHCCDIISARIWFDKGRDHNLW